jgi:hypothetical protein
MIGKILHIGAPYLDLQRLIPLADIMRCGLGIGFLFYSISILYRLAPICRHRFSRIWPFPLAVSLLVQTRQILFIV